MDQSLILEKAKPIILSKIKQYGKYIKGYEFDDLLNEGYVAALEASDKWKKTEKNGANIFAWVWLQIDCKFKDLAKIGYHKESSLEEMEYDIADEHVDAVLGDFFGTPKTSIQEDSFEACLDEAREIFSATPEKYERFLVLMAKNNFCPKSISKGLNVTPARISQLVKKFQALMDDDSNHTIAA